MKNIHSFLAIFVCIFLMNCGGGSEDYIAPYYKVYPYSKSTHAELECAMALDTDEESKHCTLGKLPLIGTETKNPSAQDIKNRLLVSDDWMGERFMALLDVMPDDIRLMLRSVTAIVIANNIRPSFYTTETGAIYLDPESLWLTQEEHGTISKEADYRSGFSDGLSFTGLWRYLKPDGTWARTPRYNRKLEDLDFPLARLLYHELAHANTFLPPSTHNKINPKHTVAEAAEAFTHVNASALVEDALPLQSDMMKELAYVMYRGETATTEQIAFNATDIGNAMAADRANDDYAYVPYSDELYYEDVAMLLEELMSKYHYNYDREIAYANATSTIYCNDLILAWGQTGRLGDSQVKEAARLAVKSLIPEADLDDFIDDLAVPKQTLNGSDWCGPLYLEARTLGKGSETNPLENPLETDISANFRSPHFQ